MIPDLQQLVHHCLIIGRVDVIIAFQLLVAAKPAQIIVIFKFMAAHIFIPELAPLGMGLPSGWVRVVVHGDVPALGEAQRVFRRRYSGRKAKPAGGGGGGSSLLAKAVTYNGLSTNITSKLVGTNPSSSGGAIVITYLGKTLP